MEQLTLDIKPAPIYKVACRVGREIHHYEVESMSADDAIKFVVTGVDNVSVAVALVPKE